MKTRNYYFKVANNTVATDLDYRFNDECYIIDVAVNCNIDLVIAHPKTKLILNFNDNIECFINTVLYHPSFEVAFVFNTGLNCKINEFLLTDDGLEAIDLEKLVNINKASRYECSCASFNDAEVAYEVKVQLKGSEATAIHNIACISKGRNKKQFDVEIVNDAVNTTGILSNFGVVREQAALIFNGVGNIKKGACNAQAHQESRIITFDEKVMAQANPYLIIDEADVEASHAAAVGQMDEEQLYYLQSRGISFNDASLLITYGYLKPILKNIKNEELKNKLEKIIEEKVMI